LITRCSNDNIVLAIIIYISGANRYAKSGAALRIGRVKGVDLFSFGSVEYVNSTLIFIISNGFTYGSYDNIALVIVVYISRIDRPAKVGIALRLRRFQGIDLFSCSSIEYVDSSLPHIALYIFKIRSHYNIILAITVYIATADRVAKIARRLRIGRT